MEKANSDKFTRQDILDMLRVADCGPECALFSSVHSDKAKEFLVLNWGLLDENGDTVHDISLAHSFDGRDLQFAIGYERTWQAMHWLECHSDELGFTAAELEDIGNEHCQAGKYSKDIDTM